MYGGKCARCGFTDSRALQLDHINGGGTKEHKRSSSYSVHKRALEGANDLQLLCANCNWIKRYENEEVAPRRMEI